MTTADQIEDDYDDLYDEEEGGISGLAILAIGLIILTVFGMIVFFSYRFGIREGQARESVPVISADPGNTRTELDFAATTNPREQEVYDTLNGARPAEVLADARAGRDPLEGFSETASAAGESGTAAVNKAENVIASAVKDTVKDTAAARPAPVTTPEVKVAETKPAPKPRPKPVTTTNASTRAVPSVASANPLSGSHVVQVGAFRSNAEAAGYYDKLRARLGSVIANKSDHIQRADLGAKGVYYRLQVGPFSSKEDATAYCNRLKANGQDCIVKAL